MFRVIERSYREGGREAGGNEAAIIDINHGPRPTLAIGPGGGGTDGRSPIVWPTQVRHSQDGRRFFPGSGQKA